MTPLRSVFVVDAVRTPLGRHGGALAGVRPDDLAARTIAGLIDRLPGLDPGRVDDVVFGNSNGAGEENRNVARMAWLLAGQPVSVPGTTVNRLCGSGLESVVQASRAIAVGDADMCVAGGVESMSRAPWVLLKPERPFAREDAALHSTTLGWRMVNPRMPSEWTVSLGEGAELLADRYGITRDDQDALAMESHRRAAQAWELGAFDDEVVPVLEDEDIRLAQDEGIRPDTTAEALARLRPAFRRSGTVTAGNASQLSDGAAAAMLADQGTVDALNIEPLARIASRATSAVEPQLYGVGPVEAAQMALKRAGIGWDDLGAVELNEAFAAQVLACLREWPDLDPARVNPQGGAIALGHPIGCSGTRLLATLAWRLRRDGGGYGLATMCIGVGQGIAVVLEA